MVWADDTYLSKVAAKMYFPFGENFTNDTGGLSSSVKVNYYSFKGILPMNQDKMCYWNQWDGGSIF